MDFDIIMKKMYIEVGYNIEFSSMDILRIWSNDATSQQLILLLIVGFFI